MSQRDVLDLLKNLYDSGNLGWFSTRQIQRMLLSKDIDIGLSSLNSNLSKLGLSVDKIPINNGFLYRFRNPKKNKFLS